MTGLIIQNKPIKLMGFDCKLPSEGESVAVAPFVDISVNITNDCNASCSFCCNMDKPDYVFNTGKFADMFDEAHSKITINKVTFTGGEPTLDIDTLNWCINYVSGRCNLITVNTNGSKLTRLNNPNIHRIALSRHHWDFILNSAIFGRMITIDWNKIPFKNKIVLVCNLIRGYIDDTNGAYKMLEFAAKHGVGEAAFVGLMPINQWSRAHMVSPDVLRFGDDTLCNRRLCYKPNVCQCANYVYVAQNGNLVYFYTRHNMEPNYNKGSRISWEGNKIWTM